MNKEERITEVNQEQLKAVLKTGKNVLVYGTAGSGKTSIATQYAEENGKKILYYQLSMVLVEQIGGIPTIVEENGIKYFRNAYDIRLQRLIEDKGKDWVIILDEITQAPQEIQNAVFQIATPRAEQRRWGEHPIPYAQVIAMTNMDDGSDGQVYLTEMPQPLKKRFFVCQLKSDKECVMKYLTNKYKKLKGVAKYVSHLLDNNIDPRTTEDVLEILLEEDTPENRTLIDMKVGSIILQELLKIKKGLTPPDPTKCLKVAKTLYETFKLAGCATVGVDTIYEENELIAKFKDEPFNLKDEEIASIIKEYEAKEMK